MFSFSDTKALTPARNCGYILLEWKQKYDNKAILIPVILNNRKRDNRKLE